MACSKAHTNKVFDMLKAQKRAISYNEGLGARLIRPWNLPLFKPITINELWFSADETNAKRPLKYAAHLFWDSPNGRGAAV